MLIEPHIEFFYPGSFVSEQMSKEIDHRDPHRVEVEDGAYAFRFYDLKTLAGMLEDGSPINKSERINVSKTYYPDGSVMTVEDVERLEPKDRYDILIRNMQGNRWKHVVRSRRGNFQPFDEAKDAVI